MSYRTAEVLGRVERRRRFSVEQKLTVLAEATAPGEPELASSPSAYGERPYATGVSACTGFQLSSWMQIEALVEDADGDEPRRAR